MNVLAAVFGSLGTSLTALAIAPPTALEAYVWVLTIVAPLLTAVSGALLGKEHLTSSAQKAQQRASVAPKDGGQ